jgi:hypothetical protein
MHVDAPGPRDDCRRTTVTRRAPRLLLAAGLAAATLAPHAAADSTSPPPPAPDPNPPAGVAPDPYTPAPKVRAPVVSRRSSYVPPVRAVTHYTPRAQTRSSVVRPAVVAHPHAAAAPTRHHVKRRAHPKPHKRRHRVVVRVAQPAVASLDSVLEAVPVALVPKADAAGVDRKRAAALALVGLCAASLSLTLLAGRRARQPLL